MCFLSKLADMKSKETDFIMMAVHVRLKKKLSSVQLPHGKFNRRDV